MAEHLNSFDSIENYPEGTSEKDIQPVDYSKLRDKALADLEEIATKKEDQNETEEEKFIKSRGENPKKLEKNKIPAHGPFIFNNYHNFFINFFKYIKEFFKYNLVGGYDARTSEIRRIKHFTLNYGSKTMSSFNEQEQESWEYPIARIEITDIKPVTQIADISRFKDKLGFQRKVLCENRTKKEAISCSFTMKYLVTSIDIEFQDSSDIINYVTFLQSRIPLNFTIFLPSYFNTINITGMIKNWEETDDINNIIIQPNNTMRNVDYIYTGMEIEPLAELQSMMQQVDKENMKYTLHLDFIFSFFMPLDIYKHKVFNTRKIDIVIDTDTNAGIITSDKPIISKIGEEVSENLNDKNYRLINIDQTKKYYNTKNQNENIEILSFSLKENYFDKPFSIYYSKVREGTYGKPSYYYSLEYLQKLKITKEYKYEDVKDQDVFEYFLNNDFSKDKLNKNLLIQIKIIKDNTNIYYYYIASEYLIDSAEAESIRLEEYYNTNIIFFMES